MKVYIFSVIIVFLLFGSSCSRNIYQHTVKKGRELDFSSGSWLINHVEVELHARAKKDLTDLVLRKFKKMGGNYVVFIEKLKPDTLNPAPPKFDIKEERLQRLESTSIYDYLVNTKVEVIEEESMIIASIAIYDIETKEKFYLQKTEKRIRFPGLLLSSRRLTRNIQNTISKALKKFEEQIEIQENTV